MTPEAGRYFDKARRCLSEAEAILAIGLGESAARMAYLAAFHAAQALIFERTGKVAKTHGGTRSAFARLTKDDPRADRTLSAFLAQAYELKSTADYGVDPDFHLSPEEAQAALAAASRFVDRVAALLAAGEQPTGQA